MIGQCAYIHWFRNITTRVSGVENIRIQSAAGKLFSASGHTPLRPCQGTIFSSFFYLYLQLSYRDTWNSALIITRYSAPL